MSKQFIDKIKHLISHGAINSPEHLDAIKGLPHAPIRIAVAQHPNASQETLNHMAADGHPSVRTAVLNHPNVHPQTLEYMRDNDESSYIRSLAGSKLK